MKKINHTPTNLEKILLISLLTFFIFLTRGSHLLTSFSLPDASFVLFFVGGMFLKEYKWLCYFLVISFGIDLLSPPPELDNLYLLNLGYFGLIISYFLSWILGEYLNRTSIFSTKKFFAISLLLIVSSYLISTLTFYYFSASQIQQNVYDFVLLYFREFFIVNTVYILILLVLIKTYLYVFRNDKVSKIESI